jgi:hypothetical protein
MAYSITYTTGGTTYNLNGTNASLGGLRLRYLGDQGFGLAPLHRITQRGPLQHGDSDVDFRLDPRILQLPLVVEASTIEAGYSAREALTRIFSPASGGGILRITTDAYDRAIECRTLGGLEFNVEQGTGYHIRTVAQLRASDPTWYDPTPVSGGATPAVEGTPTPVPLLIPWTVGASNINSTIPITNAGTWRAFPIITAVGPITDLIMTNTTTGDKIEVDGTIPNGDTWVFDLSYGRKTVVDQTGANKITAITADSSLATWSLEPGANSITVTGSSPGASSAVSIVYYTRYIGV